MSPALKGKRGEIRLPTGVDVVREDITRNCHLPGPFSAVGTRVVQYFHNENPWRTAAYGICIGEMTGWKFLPGATTLVVDAPENSLVHVLDAMYLSQVHSRPRSSDNRSRRSLIEDFSREEEEAKIFLQNVYVILTHNDVDHVAGQAKHNLPLKLVSSIVDAPGCATPRAISDRAQKNFPYVTGNHKFRLHATIEPGSALLAGTLPSDLDEANASNKNAVYFSVESAPFDTPGSIALVCGGVAWIGDYGKRRESRVQPGKKFTLMRHRDNPLNYKPNSVQDMVTVYAAGRNLLSTAADVFYWGHGGVVSRNELRMAVLGLERCLTRKKAFPYPPNIQECIKRLHVFEKQHRLPEGTCVGEFTDLWDYVPRPSHVVDVRSDVRRLPA